MCERRESVGEEVRCGQCGKDVGEEVRGWQGG